MYWGSVIETEAKDVAGINSTNVMTSIPRDFRCTITSHLC